MEEKALRVWRVSVPESGPGLFVWFDPTRESLTLRDLTPDEAAAILDEPSSVSALVRSGPDEYLVETPGGPVCDGPFLRQLNLFTGEDDGARRE